MTGPTPRLHDVTKPCSHPDCTQEGGWVYKRDGKTNAKRWMAALPLDQKRKCFLHGPAAEPCEPGKKSGQEFRYPTHNDRDLLFSLIELLDSASLRLAKAITVMPGVRSHINETIEDALEGSGGRGAGVSDPTGAAAVRVEKAMGKHRALDQAIDSIGRHVRAVEDAAEHFRIEADRALGKDQTDTSQARRCGEMVLDEDWRGSKLRPCDKISASTKRPDGTESVRDDGRCDQHAAEHDTAERRAAESDARRLRRHAS